MISDSFRDLAAVIEALEAAGCDVDTVTAPDEKFLHDQTLTTHLSVTVPFPDIGSDTPAVELTPLDVDITDAGELEVDLAVRVSQSAEETTGNHGDDLDTSLPPHRDPERLRAVYEQYDTFPEMREALGTDVTSETVRLQMIEHGIHEPDQSDTESDVDSDSDSIPPDRNTSASPRDSRPSLDDRPPKLQDNGRDVSPEPASTEVLADVTLGDIAEVLRTAETVKDVERELGLEHSMTFRLLNDLDLINHTTGELSTGDLDEISPAALEQRFQSDSSQ